MAGDRTLTNHELNRALLARQLLLERRRLSPAAAVERLVGVQAQWPPAPYVGLWSRIAAFRREALERELRAGRIVKANLMRGTLHLVTRRDYALMHAMRSELRPAAPLVAPAVRELAPPGREVTTQEALALIEREYGLTGDEARQAWQAARMRLHILHHADTALWQGQPAGRFVAQDVPEPHAPVEARAAILRRYLAAFGPASRQDVHAWSKLPMPQIVATLELLEPLRRFRDEHGRELLDLPRALLPDPATHAPPRFLPKWDNLLLSHADRTRVIPEDYRKRIVATNGDVGQSFLVDGFVAGAWRFEGGRVVLDPFAPLPRAARRDLEEEARRLVAFLV